MPLDDETKHIIENEWSLPPELRAENATARTALPAGENSRAVTGYVPDEQRIALAKAWQEVPQTLKTNPQVEGAFKTGFRLGWHAREKGT